MTTLVQAKVGGPYPVTFATAPTDGHLLVVGYGGRNGTGGPSAGYTDCGEGHVANSVNDIGAIAARVASGDSATLGGAFNNNNRLGWLEVDGIGSAVPADHGSATATAYSVSDGTVAVTTGQLLVLVAGCGSGGGFDAGGGFHDLWTLDSHFVKLTDAKVQDGHPETIVAYYLATADGSVDLTATFFNDGNGPWPMFLVWALYDGEPTPPTPGSTFDVYDPDDTFLASLPNKANPSIRTELNATGYGQFTINRHAPEATAAVIRPGNYVRVTVPQIDPNPIFGFFLEEGDFHLIDSDEQGGEELQFSGRGSLLYWARAMWLAQSFLVPWWVGVTPPDPDDVGQISFAAGTYYRWPVSGGHAGSPIKFTTGGFTAFYNSRRLYTRTGKPNITLVHLSSGSHAGWYVHPYGPGVTDRRLKSAYTLGPSVLMQNIGDGNVPGQVLDTLVGEVQAADRPIHPMPLLHVDFDDVEDSDGNPWTVSEAMRGLTAELGEEYLSTIGKLTDLGVLDVVMDPDLGFHGYNSYGRDLTGTVRFAKGLNIVGELTREFTDVRDRPAGTFAEVLGSDDSIGRVTLPDPGDLPPREISVKAETDDSTSLEDLGLAELEARLQHSDAIGFAVATPMVGFEDPDAGLYLPGPPDSARGDYWLGDLVTVHTGTDEFDFDEQATRVWAITLSWNDANALRVAVETNSGLGGIGTNGGGSSSSGGGTSGGTGSGTTISDLYQQLSERDQPNGYPSLNSDGKVPASELESQWHPSVRLAATGPVTLATLDAGDILDGFAVAEGDEVLLPAQAAGAENGVYIIQASGTAPTRRPDFAQDSDFVGAVLTVREGLTYAGTAWRVANTTAPVVDTDTLEWELWPATLGDLEAAVFGYLAHGAMGTTETFDATAAGWQSGTLDANCTFTFVAPPAGTVGQMLLELLQDGTGGHTLTLPGSVINGATLAAGLDPAAGRTTIYIFLTRDGGTNWYGFIAGGGVPVGATIFVPVMAGSPNILTTDGNAVWLPLVLPDGTPVVVEVPSP